MVLRARLLCLQHTKVRHSFMAGASGPMSSARVQDLVQEAWQDWQLMKGLHPQGEVSCSDHAAVRKSVQLLGLQPKLLVQETYS